MFDFVPCVQKTFPAYIYIIRLSYIFHALILVFSPCLNDYLSYVQWTIIFRDILFLIEIVYFHHCNSSVFFLPLWTHVMINVYTCTIFIIIIDPYMYFKCFWCMFLVKMCFSTISNCMCECKIYITVFYLLVRYIIKYKFYIFVYKKITH